MSSDEVIELSIEETQALRAKLGLAPLRVSGNNSSGGGGGDHDVTTSTTTNNNDGELSLSIDETNALRLKIGLPPLKTSSSSTTKKEGSSHSTAIHAPPTNIAAESEAKRRLEDAQAKREARERLLKLEEENKRNEGEGDESALNFAARMMTQGGSTDKATTGEKADVDTETNNNTKRKKKKKKKGVKNSQLSIPTEEEEQDNEQYTSADLQGIKVSHATSDFTSGSTTILTLADNSILDIDPESKKAIGFDSSANNPELINVNMASDSKALENLKRKRQIELGEGRA
eukprot:scaffold1670_cov136-Skeletonema_marinoi.AAC.1